MVFLLYLVFLISNQRVLKILSFNFFQGFNLFFGESVFSSLIDWFHGFNYSLLLGVLVFVIFLFFYLIRRSLFFKRAKVEYQWGELFCRIFPSFILLFQMVPSLGLLYFYGTMSIEREVSLKVIGHQWYWSYDYRDVAGLDFDSYMLSSDSLNVGDSRQLDVDRRCVLPFDVDVRFCVSSSDVIHAWALNGLSVKIDAMSGIISVFHYNFPLVGVFFGQCSEICGANHSFIPVVLEVSSFLGFKSWCLLSLE